ncbi:lysophospholipid acyltransferase family protein [Leadbettera azotonutricia]|uniref:1-acyl-sn-glycerol-3-phosphate acyltransferase n=1 Tax=Leadbettera azotonutricia (strain ATCC BAA-888 / DSM 13862 / ZAS-9) TaxID=545695 RepID=F5YGA6_LEAAZ|nr:lysophospholipid acyltransferase family protein [Leadbettera azotonutricia]AEF81149.1 1-acyl-sn-glycerol-3-phosphate acetyltransferase [Leadbettera azotonutricia ZAS-9]
MIRTILVFAATGFIMICFIPFGIVAFILSLVGLRKPMSWVIYKIAQLWAYWIIALTGCEITVSGRENIPRKGGVCFVSNHVGIFDIMLALAYIGRPFGFIAKKELILIPFIDMWIFLLGGLFIDRKQPRKALKTINEGIKRLKNGANMLVFPEGHRSRGKGLQPFRPGAFKLATSSGVSIVPMAIAGSYEVFEEKGRVRPVPVHIVFNEPIATEGMPHAERKTILADQVHKVIEAALESTLYRGSEQKD